jgi:hypothetical protein
MVKKFTFGLDLGNGTGSAIVAGPLFLGFLTPEGPVGFGSFGL